MEVLVFKTNVNSSRKATRIGNLLAAIPTIKQWNFDLDDCDKVLRIEATESNIKIVSSILRAAGFVCEELND
jgi:hypothetical protein